MCISESSRRSLARYDSKRSGKRVYCSDEDLLERIYTLRKENNEKRKKIEELTGQLKYSTEGLNGKQFNLKSEKQQLERAEEANRNLKRTEEDKKAQLNQLKVTNDLIMAEMMEMKEKISEQMAKIEKVGGEVKKLERELDLEK